jgi:hypothetical protein
MNTSSDIKIEKPKIIQALISGFETIANNPHLVLLPLLLDLFLWFGPIWRVDAFFKPLIDTLSQLPALEGPEYASILESYQTLWMETVANFNLAVSLRTLPIGVPSLMASKSTLSNPIGQPLVFSLESNLAVFGVWLGFILIGLAMGSLYWQRISLTVLESPEGKPLRSFFRSFLQALFMPLLLIIILVILSIPVMFLIALLSLISPGIGQFLSILASVIVLWILTPLIFTPHGVFLFRQNLIAAMMTSISVVRTSLSRTALFILSGLVLVEGLNYLWRSPPTDHWLLLVGIIGHAFIVTGVISASCYYFIDATKYTQTLMNKKESVRKTTHQDTGRME